jgi:PAS domain S-box-containing protein
MNPVLLWSGVAVLVAGYIAFTLVLYVVRLRPLLRARRTGGQPPPADAPTAPVAAGSDEPGGEAAESGLTVQLSREEWRYTFDAITDPVLILDTDMRVVRANRAASRLLAGDRDPVEGRTCHQLFAGAAVPCRTCPVQTVRRERKPYSQEITHRYLGRTFSVACSPISGNDTVIGYILSAKDISHQRNLERRLIHAHKLEAIATLAGGIAHDFNNILGAILGNADLLLFRLPSKEPGGKPPMGPPITFAEVEEHVQAIKRAGTRAKDLVSQILAFSRQSIGQRRNILITPVVKEACRLLRASIPATIDFHLTIGGEIGMIHADPAQIQQVLMNLCTNAVQAIGERAGEIEVSLREVETGAAEKLRYHDLQPGRYVVLTVRDTGRGIPEEMLERIFDPFFTTREVGEGSGMGLAVLHGIIVSHDGVIDVSSEPGRGSVFTVFLPRVQNPDGNEEDQMSAMPRGTETILFVDDEEDIVLMRTRMLSYLGYRVLPATGPEQALSLFADNRDRIDLLITDHTMPRMTGLQLAAAISAGRPELPIILCSGYSEAVSPEEAEQAGVRRFLAKPVDMRMLAIAIRELLPERNRGEDEDTGH